MSMFWFQNHHMYFIIFNMEKSTTPSWKLDMLLERILPDLPTAWQFDWSTVMSMKSTLACVQYYIFVPSWEGKSFIFCESEISSMANPEKGCHKSQIASQVIWEKWPQATKMLKYYKKKKKRAKTFKSPLKFWCNLKLNKVNIEHSSCLSSRTLVFSTSASEFSFIGKQSGVIALPVIFYSSIRPLLLTPRLRTRELSIWQPLLKTTSWSDNKRRG